MAEIIENRFSRHQKTTLLIVSLISFLIVFISTECILRFYFKLGDPVAYKLNKHFGWRPLPNQKKVRFPGTVVINNLSLRNEEDWDSNKDNKILMLGDSVTFGMGDNRDIISSLLQKHFQNYYVGNAGVNAWGVENIYGLVVEERFLPAKRYLTLLIEDDFFRGVSTGLGPTLTEKPMFAISETIPVLKTRGTALYRKIFASRQLRKDGPFIAVRNYDRAQIAVKKLQDMDAFLQAQGYVHCIFISPTVLQAVGKEPKDAILNHLLESAGLLPRVFYIQDHPALESLRKHPPEAIQKLYFDDVHLTKEGNQLWADILGQEAKRTLFGTPSSGAEGF